MDGLQHIVMRMVILKKTMNNKFLLSCKRRLQYWKHEHKCKRLGDTRDAFEKKVDRCRYLELSDLIDIYSDIAD